MSTKEEKETKYNLSIVSPIYEMKGKCPKEKELYNLSRSQELLKGINSADITNEQKTFLTMAAFRHAKFDYEKIAEYYAHADKNVQELMEDSALVIIDFDKAIEKGYVKLTGAIKEQYLEKHGK